MPRVPKIEFNELAMFFGDPYVIDLEDTVGSVTIRLPSIREIGEVGDGKFFMNLNYFITNTTQYRLILWEKYDKDWNVMSDFELFMMLYMNIDHEVSKLMFGDLDFAKFVPIYDKEKNENVLWNEEQGVEITQNVHSHISQYLRKAFNIYPDEKITKSEFLKHEYIMKDKQDIVNREQMKEKEQTKNKRSYLLSAISACLNYPGFKYNSKELRDLCIVEFYDSLQQIQYQIQKMAYIQGLYSGFVDSKGVKPDSLSILRE